MKTFSCVFRHRLKFVFYDNHFAFALVTITGSILLWASVSFLRNITFLGAALTGAVSLSAFALTNHLKEADTFTELFRRFNSSYDRLNEKLNKIRAGDQTTSLTTEETCILYDYFNLCGEEYLYFWKGFIYPEVWNAWLNGMRIFYKTPRIRELWDTELITNSYYGLTPAILRGEACPGCQKCFDSFPS